MQKIFQESAVEAELWLVCPEHALSICATELADTLRKFFGGCPRAIRYFFLFDKDQIVPQGGVDDLICLDHTDYDFLDDKVTNQEYDTDEGKRRVSNQEVQFGQVLNFVQYFHEIGVF